MLGSGPVEESRKIFLFTISCLKLFQGDFFTGTPQFQYQIENPQAANHGLS